MSKNKTNKKQKSIYQQGDIWWHVCYTDNKCRPCVIVSGDEINNHGDRVIIAPLTSKIKHADYTCNVLLSRPINNGHAMPSLVKVNDMQTAKKADLYQKTGKVTSGDLNNIKKAILATLDLNKEVL